MNRQPDERDMEQMVRSWMRDDDDHPADRNRQVGRIMGRIDETRQRRGAWRFLPFGRRTTRVDEDDDELYAAGGTLAMRRGVSSAMAIAAVAVLIVMGAAFVALLPAPATGPGAQPLPSATPMPTIYPEDVALQASFTGVWSGERTTLDEVLAVYADDAVHTALWQDRVERFDGPEEIWERIRASATVKGVGWIPLLDAGTGEHRYLGVTDDLGGIACVLWVEDALITRHDCILPAASTDLGAPTFEPADGTIDVARALSADLVPGWGTADRELIERSVSPEIVHTVAYDNHEVTLSGIDEYMTVMGYGEIKELAPPVPLPALEGEHRWTDFNSVAGGSLCTFWERDGLIVRHDCIVPTFTYVPSSEEDG